MTPKRRRRKLNKSVHSQIMRRLIPILAAVFVVFALVGLFLLQNIGRARATQELQGTLSLRAQRIESILQQALQDATRIAQNVHTVSFAQEAQTETNSELESQQELLSDFISVARANSDTYRSIRYVTPAGDVWTEVTNQGQVSLSDTRRRPNVLSDNDDFLNTIFSSQPTLSMFDFDEQTVETDVVLRVFYPIIDANQNDIVLGAIEILLSANPVLELVNDNQGQVDYRWVLVNSLGDYLGDSASPLQIEGQPITVNYFRKVAENEPELANVLRETEESIDLTTISGNLASVRNILVGSAADMPWRLVLMNVSGSIIPELVTGIIFLLVASVVGFGLTVSVVDRLLKQRLSVIGTARAKAVQLAEGRIDDTFAPGTDGDEVGQMMDAFSRISLRLHDTTAEIEEYQQRHSRNLEIAAKISRETAMLAETEDLMNRLVELICDDFNLYHAQIYTLDDIGLNAVLSYSRGSIGRQMLENPLKVLIGSRSMVGQACATGKPQVINDTTDPSANYVPNPLLPEARARLVVPLMAAENAVGALDLYSERRDAFKDDLIRLYQLLADQIAITYHKSRQLSQSQQRLQQTETLNRQLTRNAWGEFEERIGLADSYHYDLTTVQPGSKPEMGRIAAINAPITIRGEVIGSIAAVAPEGLPFVEGDLAILRAVADRVGLAIEGARLFQETQASLAITSTLYQLSRSLNEADQLDEVIKAIVTSVAADASGGQIWLFDEYSPGALPQWLELKTDWAAEARPDKAEGLTGTRLFVPDSLFLSSLRENQVKVVTDMLRDRRIDDDLRAILRRLDARAAVFVPFSVRAQWRGILVIDFPNTREFNETEGRIYTALIDQAGVAIDNRLLISQTEMTLDQIERLYAASRIINQAQNYVDMMRATLASTTDTLAVFELGLLEGQLDANGWPTAIHFVAGSSNGQAFEMNRIEAIQVSPTSPLRHREPVIIEDAAQNQGFTAIFPLFSANQPIALLYIRSQEAGEISSEDYEIYKSISGQMSTVLENRRLLIRTEAALDETRLLYNASRSISTAQDSNAVYRAASEHLSQPLEAVSRITVLLAGPDPGYDAPYFDTVYVWERVALSSSPIQIGQRLSAEVAPFGSLMSQVSGAVAFKDLDRDLADQNRLRLVLTRAGASSALVMPIGSPRQWFGVIIIESEQAEVFTEQYQRFAQAITDQVAIAVENRVLFDQAQMEAQRALALAEVGQLAARIGEDFERNISEVFVRVSEPANYDRWNLMLVSPDDPLKLERAAWQTADGDTAALPANLDLRTAEHSLADCFRQGRLLLVNDPSSYPAFLSASPDALAAIGKHIAMPVRIGSETVGALLIGRGLDRADLDENDEQLVRTLAAQIAVAIENRRLYRKAEGEREYLRSILETLPAGMVVLDAHTLQPIQANARAEELLGRPVNFNVPFSVAEYKLLRTGVLSEYPAEELPIYQVARYGEAAFSDDLAILHDDGSQVDLLLNAAPITDGRGSITNIVAALQDVSNLRGLENALQSNLREQISLYEATRNLAEAPQLDDALDVTISQALTMDPLDGYIVLLDPETGDLTPVRAVNDVAQFNLPHDIFREQLLKITHLSFDTDLPEAVRGELLAQGIYALMSVPMRARDSLLGWLVLVFGRTLDSLRDGERFLVSLADNAALAIDNRNLLITTENAFQEATILYELSRALANATKPEDVVNAAAEKLSRDYIDQIFMVVPLGEEARPSSMVVVAAWQREGSPNINLDGMTLSADQFPAWSLITAGEFRNISDSQADTTLSELERQGIESLGVRSVIVLPLRATNRLLGSIWLGCDQQHDFAEDEIRTLRSFAEQASVRMEASRLYEQTERRARQLATSSEVSSIASSILDLNELMNRAVYLIQDSFNYDHVQIFLMDEDDVFAELKASTGEPGRQLLAIKHRLAKGSASVIGQVTATGVPAIALDTADARFVHKPNPYLPLTRSEMALPLVVEDAVVGALDVQSNQPHAFSDEDVNVLKSLAAQISVAIKNARLYDESQSRARDMEFLFEVTTAAATPDRTLIEALEQIASMICLRLDVLNATIYLGEEIEDGEAEPYTWLRPVALAGSRQPLSEVADVLVGDPQNYIGTVAAEGEAQIIGNIEREPRYLPITASARSALVAPMLSGTHLVGVIALEDDRINGFRQESLNLMAALTSSLSAIVQNAQLLEQVTRTNDQLRELDRLKSDFLANMSHELRTPLNSIIGFSRVILKGIDGPLTEMQEQDLNTIYNSGSHLLGLINDILDQAKINSGKMDLHPDYFDIKAVVDGVRSIGIGLIKDKPVDLRVEQASGLPKAYGDEFRTRQVLLNLVSNAAKFTQRGSITIRVYTTADPDTNKTVIRVDVQDTGIGIAEKDLPLLFEAFRQVDSSLTRTVGGTGLGLPIAKSLIEMQGGHMLVESQIDVGSTFSILIPIEQTAPIVSTEESDKPKRAPMPRPRKKTAPLDGMPQDANPAPDEKQQAHSAPRDTTETTPARDYRSTLTMSNVLPIRRQILLVEENPDMVDQYRRFLQREGFDVFAASIPLEAEAMVSGLHPTLIIMSSTFSNGASWDILKRLKSRDDTADIPVIMVALQDESQRATDAGAFSFLRRPFTPEQLVESVQAAERESQIQRILIIDDQPDSTRLLREFIDQFGNYRVFSAHSGAEGISMVARRRPDLIILDLRMPEMDGFAVLDELRSTPETASIPVMIVTNESINAEERTLLEDLAILFKTDLNQENYQEFINTIKAHLTNGNVRG
ncbi:MAG: GAF domain-containing protein [Anaerolineae bacterium]|nr:GAF domain-containing protein [Anaerolineae bacterium]